MQEISCNGYEVEVLTIGKDTLRKLEEMKNRRRIVRSHVNRLLKVLRDGGSFDAPIVVNRLNGTYRLIDGNHRTEAIKLWIKENPENQTRVLLIKYEGLSDKEERDVFRRWNSGRKQSSDDFVQMHRSEIPLLMKMQEEFPVNVKIYPLNESETGLHFSSTMKAYLMTRVEFPKFRPFGGGPTKFVQSVEVLGDEDYDNLAKFVEFFANVFGPMSKRNMYQTTTMLNCLMTLYFDNVAKHGEENIIGTFLKRIKDNVDMITAGKSGGRSATAQLYRMMVLELMKSIRTDLKIRELGVQEETEEIPANADETLM